MGRQLFSRDEATLLVKAAMAVGKNHEVPLMMMTATAASAATTSGAITTRGLRSGLGSGSRSKNSRSHFKLILYFFRNSCPLTKFHPNRAKK